MEDPSPNSWARNQPSRGGTACHHLGSQPGGAQHNGGEVLPGEENVAKAFDNTREQGQSAQAGIPKRWELENGAGRQEQHPSILARTPEAGWQHPRPCPGC